MKLTPALIAKLEVEELAPLMAKLDLILSKLSTLEQMLMTTDEAIAALAAKVAEQSTVVESAVTLINGLAAQLTAAADDPAQIMAIVDSLTAQSGALAGAVEANTPPPPAPV